MKRSILYFIFLLLPALVHAAPANEGIPAFLAIFGIFGLGFFLFFFFITALSILSMVFWILMLIDCAKRKFPSDQDKTIWILIVALTGIIGAAVYYFVVKAKDKK